MDATELRSVLEFSVEVATLAGVCTLGYFGRRPDVTLKEDGSPVTDADRAAERLIRECISERFPDHGIVGEEAGETKSASPGRWIIDPIDGTYSFVCGVPLYAVLVAFEYSGEVVSGVIHMPALRETVWAARGMGCYHDGRRTRVSDVGNIEQARIAHSGVRSMERSGRGREFARLIASSGSDRGWSDAYGYALVATGRAEVALDPVMKLWDVAALVPILVEAGGTLTDWNGQSTHTATEALATNGKLLPAVLEAIRG